MTKIIAISGMSGSGKTTLIKALLDRFKDTTSRFIALDDYSGSNHWYPDWHREGGDRLFAYRKWVSAGSDPDKSVYTPELKQDLMQLKASDELDFIFLEEPFGRLRKEIKRIIDLNIHLDIPLDVALARETIRGASNGVDAVGYLQAYVDSQQRVLFITQDRAREQADLTVDGMSGISEIANETADFIRSHS